MGEMSAIYPSVVSIRPNASSRPLEYRSPSTQRNGSLIGSLDIQPFRVHVARRPGHARSHLPNDRFNGRAPSSYGRRQCCDPRITQSERLLASCQ